MLAATACVLLVQVSIAGYLNRLAQLGVAGVRVDAAKHMNSWDVGSILQVSPHPTHINNRGNRFERHPVAGVCAGYGREGFCTPRRPALQQH